jgi:hypothetical protein
MELVEMKSFQFQKSNKKIHFYEALKAINFKVLYR